jgi:hypothetical protein
MIYADYLTQEEPRHPVNVKMEVEDCYQLYKVFCGHIAVLKILGIYYSYLIISGTTLFWTMDNHGNKKSPSVFSLKEPIKS